MRLFEYRAKELMRKYGIPVPRGFTVFSPNELKELDFRAVVKAQVLVGGRGKAGGIRFADNIEEARERAAEILPMTINGEKVRGLLVEERLEAKRELYLSLLLDRSRRTLLLIASPDGGMEIESVPEGHILMLPVPPSGYSDFIGRSLKAFLHVDEEGAGQIAVIVRALLEMFMAEDCELAEINPLILTSEGRVIAADAKVTINDDALFRHPEFSKDSDDLTPLERKAKEESIAFVQLDGNIGVIANGAGLTMATLDILTLNGGKAGVFLDLGGTDDPAKVKAAFDLMKEASPAVIFLNIFGGITKCDTVARGVKSAMGESKIAIPVVARIRGVNDDIARSILKEIGIDAYSDLVEAARKAISLAGR